MLSKRTSGKYIRDNFSDLMNISKVPIYLVNDVNDESCFDLIKGMDSDIIVFEGSKIIRSPKFELPKIGMLNVHAAILPYLRGCSCLEWSIFYNYPVGVTCHFVVTKVYAGPIVTRVKLVCDKKDT